MIRVLICDDAPTYRAALRSAFDDYPEIEVVGEAEEGEEAIRRAVELLPDVVLMDVRMPVLNGFAATRRIRELLPQTRVIALAAYDERGVVVAMIAAGATAYSLKGAPSTELRRAIAAATDHGYLDDRLVPQVFPEIVRLYHHEQAVAAQLTEAKRRLERDLAELTCGVVRALVNAVEARDGYTGGHIERVTRWALLLTERVAPELARDPLTEFGYILHDVGKLGVPDAILRKAGPLSTSELAQMRAHVEIGARMLKSIPDFEPVCAVVLHHHERWDGSGYPAGLRGEDIPLAARLFAVCDAFDAMTSDRPHRAALSESAALAELEAGAGSQLDPQAVRQFVALAGRGLVTAPPSRRLFSAKGGSSSLGPAIRAPLRGAEA